MGQRGGDAHVDKLADQPVRAGKVDRPVIAGSAGQFVGILARSTFDEDAFDATHHAPADGLRACIDGGLQARQPRLLDFQRYLVGEAGSRRTGARAIHETVAVVEADVLDELHRLLEILFRFSRKADDEIRCDGNAGPGRAQAPDDGPVFQRGIAALHRGQYPVGARLHGKVHVIDQLGQPPVRVDQALRKFPRMRRRVAQPFDAGHFREILQQQREVRRFAVVHRAAICVYILTQQRDLPDTLFRQAGDFREHIVERPGNFLAAGVRHDAETAVFAAAFHDGDESGAGVDFRRRHGVEFFNFRKGDVDLRAAAALPRLDQLRQAVQGLRTEHDIHVRRALHDDGPFLACHATPHADDEVRARLFQFAQAAKGVKHAFLRVFTHRAGVEQNDVGLRGIVGFFECRGRSHDVGHFGRVVLVHLAAVSADIELLHSLTTISFAASAAASAAGDAPLLRRSAAIHWPNLPWCRGCT